MLISLLMFYIVIRLYSKEECIKCMIYSCSLWTLFLYADTELLSVFKILAYRQIMISWGAVCGILIALVLYYLIVNKENLKDIRLKRLNSGDIGTAFIFAAYSVFMLYLAYRIVPYNWDSMAYHCARIPNWVQNRTVAHYAASVMRQVCSPALAEFVNLHIYILMHGSDVLFNWVQCCSYLLNIILVYKISGKIGCRKTEQIFAAVLFATSPTCFAEALSTQVDEFAALWMLCYTYQILDIIFSKKSLKTDRQGKLNIIFIALDIAFGYLTKPTVILAMVLFAFWMIMVCIRRREDIRRIAVWIVSIPVTALLVIIPELARNIYTFHAISPQGAGRAQMVGSADPRYIFVGMLKNLFHNLPSVYWPWMNRFLQDIVYWTAYHIGIEADNEVIFEGGRAYELATAPDYSYDTSVNPVISALFFACIIVFAVTRIINIKKHKKRTAGYSTYAFAAFIIFCAVARWEIFISRYMIAYFAILSPAIAMQIQKICESSSKKENGSYCRGMIKGFVYFVCLTGLIGMVQFHWAHILRSADRCQGYFAWMGDNYQFDKDVADKIKEKKWENIGMQLGCGSYEYPLWKILNNDGYTVKHVNVQNETCMYEDKKFIPDCIIVLDTEVKGDSYVCHGRTYKHIWRFNDNCIFITP